MFTITLNHKTKRICSNSLNRRALTGIDRCSDGGMWMSHVFSIIYTALLFLSPPHRQVSILLHRNQLFVRRCQSHAWFMSAIVVDYMPVWLRGWVGAWGQMEGRVFWGKTPKFLRGINRIYRKYFFRRNGWRNRRLTFNFFFFFFLTRHQRRHSPWLLLVAVFFLKDMFVETDWFVWALRCLLNVDTFVFIKLFTRIQRQIRLRKVSILVKRVCCCA